MSDFRCPSFVASESSADDVSNSVLFGESMCHAEEYPKNMIYSPNYAYQRKEYHKLLQENKAKLFGSENCIDFFDFQNAKSGAGTDYPAQPRLDHTINTNPKASSDM